MFHYLIVSVYYCQWQNMSAEQQKSFVSWDNIDLQALLKKQCKDTTFFLIIQFFLHFFCIFCIDIIPKLTDTAKREPITRHAPTLRTNITSRTEIQTKHATSIIR